MPGGTIIVELAGNAPAMDHASLLAWVRNSTSAVAGFYGRFPVTETRLIVSPKAGRGVSGGRTWAEDGGLIRIRVGEASTPEDYANDWVLVHEMALSPSVAPGGPGMARRGLATMSSRWRVRRQGG